MFYTQGDYSKHYITEALFKLMESMPYKDVTVSDIAKKAGVGRATFYRYFTCKEDVVSFFFDRTTAEFSGEQIYRPRCVEDYEDIVRRVIKYIKLHKFRLQLLCNAHLDYIYSDYVNAAIARMFEQDQQDDGGYKAAGYAGAITGITLHWVKNNCRDDENDVFNAFVTVALGGMKKN